jgi:hypothetical protein
VRTAIAIGAVVLGLALMALGLYSCEDDTGPVEPSPPPEVQYPNEPSPTPEPPPAQYDNGPLPDTGGVRWTG